jgi:hypothetical protein
MKNFYFLAFLIAMLLFACTADGVFNVEPDGRITAEWSKDVSSSSTTPSSSSNPILPSSSSSNPIQPSSSSLDISSSSSLDISSSSSLDISSSSSVVSTTGSCNYIDTEDYGDLVCREGMSQAACSSKNGTFNSSGCATMYCYNYDGAGDCAPIGYNCYFYTTDECIEDGGTVQPWAWCKESAPSGFYGSCYL